MATAPLLFHLSRAQLHPLLQPITSSVCCFFFLESILTLLFLSLLPQNVYVNINRIMSVGNRLLESGHYASQQIKQISGQLEQEWKAFAAALDERSTLLEMSASFHQKCDQVGLMHTEANTEAATKYYYNHSSSDELIHKHIFQVNWFIHK